MVRRNVEHHQLHRLLVQPLQLGRPNRHRRAAARRARWCVCSAQRGRRGPRHPTVGSPDTSRVHSRPAPLESHQVLNFCAPLQVVGVVDLGNPRHAVTRHLACKGLFSSPCACPFAVHARWPLSLVRVTGGPCSLCCLWRRPHPALPPRPAPLPTRARSAPRVAPRARRPRTQSSSPRCTPGRPPAHAPSRPTTAERHPARTVGLGP